MTDPVSQGAKAPSFDLTCRYGRILAVVLAFVAVAAGYGRMWFAAEILLTFALIVYALTMGSLLRPKGLDMDSGSGSTSLNRPPYESQGNSK